ncbi:MAG: hypothetical protein PHV99_00685 [Candidatus Pacebacteria bacterium]|nr:hypothetical protein [Candidatus Paceibacterota bacterium]
MFSSTVIPPASSEQTRGSDYRGSLAWNQFVTQINNLNEAGEPCVIDVAGLGKDKFRGFLTGARIQGLFLILESPEQFKKTGGGWQSTGFTEYKVHISNHVPLPVMLQDGRIEVVIEGIIFVIYPYGRVECPRSVC